VYTFLAPLFLAAAIREATKSIDWDGSLWDKYQILHVLGEQVTRRILLLATLKWTAESNQWHLFNSYPCKQWINSFLSKLKLYCRASLSRVNVTEEKEEEKKEKWISPFPFVYGGSLFSLDADLGWGLGKSIFLPNANVFWLINAE